MTTLLLVLLRMSMTVLGASYVWREADADADTTLDAHIICAMPPFPLLYLAFHAPRGWVGDTDTTALHVPAFMGLDWHLL